MLHPTATRLLAGDTAKIEGKLPGQVSASTAERYLKLLFRRSIEKYHEACRKGTVAFFVQGLGEAQRTVGTSDPEVLANVVSDDGIVQKPRRRKRGDD